MSMGNAYFITGTDTAVGKTLCTCALLHRARAQGLRAVGMKPVAAGAELLDGRRVNDDAAALAAASSFAPEPGVLNPYCLAAPVAPHIAAAEEGVRIETGPILKAFRGLRGAAELVLVEGAGGFRVPLGPELDSAALAVQLGVPMILIVGLRLGCINHALLTVEAIQSRGLHLAGWIANAIDPSMLRREHNVEALRERIAAPLLGELPHQAQADPARAAAHLALPVPAAAVEAAIAVLDSAAEMGAAHRGRVVITGSHGGASAARYALAAQPALVFFNDAGGGKHAAGLAALPLLEQAGIAAACYSHESACIGDGRDAFGNGRVSHANAPAQRLGVRAGEPVVAAATRVLESKA